MYFAFGIAVLHSCCLGCCGCWLIVGVGLTVLVWGLLIVWFWCWSLVVWLVVLVLFGWRCEIC